MSTRQKPFRIFCVTFLWCSRFLSSLGTEQHSSNHVSPFLFAVMTDEKKPGSPAKTDDPTEEPMFWVHPKHIRDFSPCEDSACHFCSNINSDFLFCERCGLWWNLEDSDIDYNGKATCPNCINYIRCSHCNCTTETISVDSEHRCQDCVKHLQEVEDYQKKHGNGRIFSP